MALRSTCIGAACVVPGARAEISMTKIAEWTIPEVATLHEADNLPGRTGKSLVGTTFGPHGTDYVFALGPLELGQDAQYTVLSDKFLWPNEAKEVSQEVKAKAGLDGEYLTVADGFLVPFTGKKTGSISLLKIGEDLTGVATKITQDKKDWFFHHSEWADMDGDGVLDIVAARATVPIPFGKTDSELVWVKNNGDGTFGSTEVITHGPGVAFRLVDIDGDGQYEVVATEFFLNQQLAVYSCPESTWAECASKQNVVETVLDTGDGPWFDLEWVDLNGDGKKDLLCTSQQFKKNIFSSVTPGKVWAFEHPAGWTAGSTEAWTRHELASNYYPEPKISQGAGAPGAPSTFVLNANVGGKVHILLSSDDGGLIDILEPASQASDDWTYNKQTVYNCTAETSQGLRTVGTPRAFDSNGDGIAELFIPSYAENKLLMYTFDAALAVAV